MKLLSSVLVAMLCGSLSVALHAEPPEGKGWKKHHKHKKHSYKEEYWEGNCKIERKWKRNGDYKEERTCKNPNRYAHHHGHRDAARVIILPPWFDQRAPEPEYRPEWRPTTRTSVSRCNSDQVGSVLGGLIGGVIGHQIGDGRGNTAATIGGAIAGVLIGGEVGRRMDQRNQACVAQALEFAPEGERITWQNTQGNENYAVIPGSVEMRGDQYCRSYTAEFFSNDASDSTRGTACRQPDGTWVRSI
ncbi:glycine zipper 2TM domain-containing protein [Microbulbifer agarilyticus]|uniref:glycine zipper 2TM domain-containing protein n=1 Tax=Microbulbifer agarilyticus TaxID=260552 RepID=UPI001CD41734|nr:glycine zipper 2TM domain-containing protein [Microbulbifer agarilyticus]MCA0894882.1 glycine zipper 2TM domain-containing protein [Microbulbifer agarilyticus]